jgi:phosphate transport system permease protein
MNRAVKYQIYGILFLTFTFAATMSALGFLAVILGDVLAQGLPHLDWDFITGIPSRKPQNAGIFPSMIGTIYMMFLTSFFAIPMGIGAAMYLEEYAHNTRMIRFIKLNIQNLAGVPSIVYGILGLTLFVRFADLGRSLIAGSLTMALMILPVITISAQESLRSEPDTFRFAGFGIGMTRWQVIRHEVMPLALPGMLTGVILALSRAIGEAAPLMLIGAITFVANPPQSLTDQMSVLPIQIYNWTSRPQSGFHDIAASGIIVLLVILLSMNAAAIYLRSYFHRKLKGTGK